MKNWKIIIPFIFVVVLQTACGKESAVGQNMAEQKVVAEVDEAIEEAVEEVGFQEETVEETEIKFATTHGALRVEDSQLVDQNGEPIQLYGMSTHGIAWFPQFVSYDSFKTLRDDWHTNSVRLAMYTHEYNGYCTGGRRRVFEIADSYRC